MMISYPPAADATGMPAPAPVRAGDAAARLGLDGAELAALVSLVRACGPVLVADVATEPAPAPAPVRAPAPAWDAPAPAVRTAKCACCGLRRDLVAHTSMAAEDADLCFRCGSDRAQGLGYCSSAPRTSTQTFSDSDWDAPA